MILHEYYNFILGKIPSLHKLIWYHYPAERQFSTQKQSKIIPSKCKLRRHTAPRMNFKNAQALPTCLISLVYSKNPPSLSPPSSTPVIVCFNMSLRIPGCAVFHFRFESCFCFRLCSLLPIRECGNGLDTIEIVSSPSPFRRASKVPSSIAFSTMLHMWGSPLVVLGVSKLCAFSSSLSSPSDLGYKSFVLLSSCFVVGNNAE